MSEPTNQENNIIESVEKIFDNRRIYNIPEYQRGYKWNEEDVEALLNDIDKFEEVGDQFYCLQNITIKKQEDNNNIYEVIDGQQRLTTLSILLSYLGKTNLLNKIQYSIREESGKFLYELLEKKEIDYLDNNLSYNDNFNKDYDSQDVFHFCLAKHTIINFFGNHEKGNFKNKLLEHVKLIVNDVSNEAGNKTDVNDVKGETIFKNLNSNKVALEYYDLIRAIFITRVKKEDKESDIDLAEKRIKIGIDIDNMNIWWSDKNVKEYFKIFSGENNISMLYDLYWKCRNEVNNSKSESNNNKEKSNNEALFKYLDSNTGKSEEVFKEVVRFHNTMADWYEDKEIYHLLGFIGKHIEKDINTIWSIWEKTNTSRESFKNELKRIIKDDLIKNIENENYLEAIGDTNKNWYYQENNTIKLLVLMDIIKILNNKNINHKLPANYFYANGEDIEHIFSKTPNKQTTIKDAIDNIDLIVNLVNDDKYKEELCDFVKDLEEEKKLKNEMTTLHSIGKLEKYRDVIREVPCVHSIGNLVLLVSDTNRSYGNNPYIEKRRRIIEQHEIGEKYIRNHTWSIFSKNIKLKDGDSVNSEELDKWTIKDIEITAKYIKEKIEEFFNGIK
ncbi:DUF262 domain-containing protein [Brachyspira sp. G79]|uniref:DUF262 domain-containing protein n=1 Tax=Brachyspira sp. G79 TaxID=1358104 RepID=UPI000BBB74DB|nr:DUF262 domain-containing protein [Brachyspira sp. G79]PCG20306.1 hypothetical protein KQ44_10005 [Brachyspira sp. G79]